MMSLTSEDIRLILDKIGREVVVSSIGGFGFDIVSSRSSGNSGDPAIGRLQAKLSIMLQDATLREEYHVKASDGQTKGCCTFPDTCSKCMPA
jgi:hypothetical protein